MTKNRSSSLTPSIRFTSNSTSQTQPNSYGGLMS